MFVERMERRCAQFLEYCAMALMVGLVGVIAYSVAARQFLLLSVAWSEEVASGLLLWMVMLGSAAAWSRRRHIAIDVLLRRVGLRVRHGLSIFIELGSILLFAIAANGAVLMMHSSANLSTTALGISYTWLFLALAVGLGSMIVFSLLHLSRLLIRGPTMLLDIDVRNEWTT